LRKAKKRTVEDLQEFLFAAVKAFSAEECSHYLAHCGYLATAISKLL